MDTVRIQLCLCIAKHIAHIREDGLANSTGHLTKLEEDNRALFELLHGRETSIPLHINRY